METKGNCKVCVTGGAGYIGSLTSTTWLHCDESKVGLLKSFPYAEERLHLFEADICKPEEFEKAIQGCVFVFHVAYPIFHNIGSYKSNNVVEVTICAVKKIAEASGTVKRLIYTATIGAASPLKNELEVVTLGCGMVGGGGCLPNPSTSVLLLISQVANNATNYQSLRYSEELAGKIPIVHIVDVCRAHIFCAETPLVTGRFLCASSIVCNKYRNCKVLFKNLPTIEPRVSGR
ncbi:putative dihydroflavanol 4-reductase [Helianthus debilis subsp. tardiflorus]